MSDAVTYAGNCRSTCVSSLTRLLLSMRRRRRRRAGENSNCTGSPDSSCTRPKIE
jgi:hypothetical protein